MKVTACLLVGIREPLGALVRASVQTAYPDSTIGTPQTLEEASETNSGEGLQIVVLAEAGMVPRFAAVVDQSGLRRWAIVMLGVSEPFEGVEVVPEEECQGLMISRALRSAVAQQALVRQNMELRNFLLTIAHRVHHDLRTPLGGIVSATEMIQEVIADTNPADAALAVPLLDSATELSRLLSRVGAFLKASAKPIPKTHDAMTTAVWAATVRLEGHAAKVNATLVQPDSWPDLDCRGGWIEIIWENLLANALQHGGKSPQVELGWERLNGDFKFWVKDNGPGPAPEICPLLFQPFHLLHQPNARRGFGLSIVQKLVDLQDGHCGYEPRSEGGSCFYFTLPANGLS